MELGIALSSEENSPADLVRHARAAEAAGLGFGLISDHIHPWVDAQGHSPFVWSVLGAIAQEIVQKFDDSGGSGKPKYGQVTACWATSKDEAKKTAFENWPNVLVEGSASQELPRPSDFEQLVEDREADDIEGTIPLGPDVDEY